MRRLARSGLAQPRPLPAGANSVESRSPDDVEAEVGLPGHIGVPVDLVEELVENPHEDIHAALITPHRVAVVVMPIEDRKADTNQRGARIALQEFAVGVADE